MNYQQKPIEGRSVDSASFPNLSRKTNKVAEGSLELFSAFRFALLLLAWCAGGRLSVGNEFVWTKLQPALPGRVFYSMAPLPNNSAIACFGGRSGNWRGTDSCDLFDPVDNVWRPGPVLPAGANPRTAGIAIALPRETSPPTRKTEFLAYSQNHFVRPKCLFPNLMYCSQS